MSQKYLKSSVPMMLKAVWKSVGFFKTFLKESDHENASNNFCGIFGIYTHASLKDSYQ